VRLGRRSPLDLAEPAVYDEVCAGDEAGVGGSQEQRSSPDFRAGSQPSERDCGGDQFPKLGDTVLKSAVSIEPGLTTFTRIPRTLSSAAQVRASERTAALLAE
jgi:hypothetical protein